MSEPLPRPDFDRRRHQISHEELRRHLIDADADRFRLQNALRAQSAAARPEPAKGSRARRRMAVGVGAIVITGLAGGLAWQMCPSSIKAAKAADRGSVRVQTLTVSPRLVAAVSETPSQTVGRRPARAASAAGTSLSSGTMRRVVRRTAAHRASVRRVTGGPPHDAPAPQRAIVSGPPRPLSPSEFGRARTVAY